MKVYAITDIGRVRALNEDSYYLPRQGERFCAVADGMGGHNAGEVASAMAVQVFSEHMREVETITGPVLRAAVERANGEVYRAALDNEGMSGMGTTFSALAQQDGDVLLAHVGDSRIYLVRHGAIMQLTTDHTLVEEMVRKGMLTPREARFHPRRNIITRALGTDPDVAVDIIQMAARPGDVFFLCSDGMTNYAEEQDILRAALADGDWDEKLRGLVSVALENGGADNITALFAIIGEEAAR
ncbi:MAG: Stp1/IreP family PP2C-type Ser/Thr phosphatase [Clostridia bacterium]|nr:Stp1/IreP family PP2C-type Ser/Thr phosphatase [Clostridia bacterium]MBQ6123297.1 Stp1/IreP family PP2C-type Ser/Thr phosphatase [Clostridia bacterium]